MCKAIGAEDKRLRRINSFKLFLDSLKKKKVYFSCLHGLKSLWEELIRIVNEQAERSVI